MKYLLRPLDPDYPDIWFDTNNINDLARLGGWDEDVVYIAGTAYHAPLNERRPSTRVTIKYVRELEAEAVKVKAERDALESALNSALTALKRISDDGKAHCYVSRFQDGTVVYAKKNKASDSFFVRGTGEGGE